MVVEDSFHFLGGHSPSQLSPKGYLLFRAVLVRLVTAGNSILSDGFLLRLSFFIPLLL